jgi:hypothetical protein
MAVFYNFVTFAMQENIKQRYAMVFKWHKAFKEGRENFDDPRSGRPISSTNDQNVEEVRAVMVKERRLSVRMISELTD